MKDIQTERDERNIPLEQVGVSDLSYPIVVLDRQHEKQATIASISMSVNLPKEFKGTHMSRFIEVLNEHRGEVTIRTIPKICTHLREHLQAERARIEVRFPYFIEKPAPVSGALGLMDYEVTLIGEVGPDGEVFTLGVRVPVTSCCPCSKAISDYGAHNQRGYITIEIEASEFVWLEDIVLIAERASSCPVYPLLKRADERQVTMQAYDNPVFVEDMVRNAAGELLLDARVRRFRVSAKNIESIHNHSAFAVAQKEWVKQ